MGEKQREGKRQKVRKRQFSGKQAHKHKKGKSSPHGERAEVGLTGSTNPTSTGLFFNSSNSSIIFPEPAGGCFACFRGDRVAGPGAGRKVACVRRRSPPSQEPVGIRNPFSMYFLGPPGSCGGAMAPPGGRREARSYRPHSGRLGMRTADGGWVGCLGGVGG